MPSAVDDRDGQRKRVKGIRAFSMTWYNHGFALWKKIKGLSTLIACSLGVDKSNARQIGTPTPQLKVWSVWWRNVVLPTPFLLGWLCRCFKGGDSINHGVSEGGPSAMCKIIRMVIKLIVLLFSLVRAWTGLQIFECKWSSLQRSNACTGGDHV